MEVFLLRCLCPVREYRILKFWVYEIAMSWWTVFIYDTASLLDNQTIVFRSAFSCKSQDRERPKDTAIIHSQVPVLLRITLQHQEKSV